MEGDVVFETESGSKTIPIAGGALRSLKGALGETMAEEMIMLAWKNIGGELSPTRYFPCYILIYPRYY